MTYGPGRLSTTGDGARVQEDYAPLANTGGGAAHNNLQPYIALNYIIYVGGASAPTPTPTATPAWYTKSQADSRYVNETGDNMTGALTISGNAVWHAGNDGSGSGLDADKWDGVGTWPEIATYTPQPTYTPYPTATPAATYTPQPIPPTYTPAATYTPAPTYTPQIITDTGTITGTGDTVYLPYLEASVYTYTLASGNVLRVPVGMTMGQIIISSILLALAAVLAFRLVTGITHNA